MRSSEELVPLCPYSILLSGTDVAAKYKKIGSFLVSASSSASNIQILV
jgi:hypothetical protein